MPPDALREPTFVGAGRDLMVDGLVSVFSTVADNRAERGHAPVWVSIEAPTGWGKTRIAREFYRKLADSEHNPDPKYWPSTVFQTRDGGAGLGDVGSRRKHVNPEVDHVPGSLPGYLWWGIECFKRRGLNQDALAYDFRILKDHEPYLAVQWGRANPLRRDFVPFVKHATDKFRGTTGDRLKAEALGRLDDFVDVVSKVFPTTHFIRAVSEEIAEGVLPGFGWLLKAAGKSIEESVRRRVKETALVEGVDEIGGQDEAVLSEAVTILTTLSKPSLPMVIFIEDVHLADDMLLRLLVQLVKSDAPIMVVSTGWPGSLENIASRLSDEDLAKLNIVRLHYGEQLPDSFPAGASMEALTPNDLGTLLDSLYSVIEPDTRALLLGHFTSPLMLELVVQFYTRNLRGRPLILRPSEVTNLTDIEHVFDLYWRNLPDDVQDALAFSTAGIPALLQGDDRAPRTWNSELLAKALERSKLGSQSAYHERIEQGRSQYAWVDRIDDTLRQFPEFEQMKVASRNSSLSLADRKDLHKEILSEARTAVGDGLSSDGPVQYALDCAQLLLSMADSDVVDVEIDHDTFAEATLVLMRSLENMKLESKRILRLGVGLSDRRIDIDSPVDREVALRTSRAQKYAKEFHAALEGLDALSLWALSDDAWNNPEGLTIRLARAEVLRLSGDWLPSKESYECVLEDARALKVVPQDIVADAANGLATVLGFVGSREERSAVLRELLTQQVSWLGPDHPTVVKTRWSFAVYSGTSGEAEKLYHELWAEQVSRLGPDDPATLETIKYLGYHLSHSRAVDLHRTVLRDQTSRLGDTHALVAETRNQLGSALAGAQQWEEAAAVGREVVAHLLRGDEQDPRSIWAAKLNLANSMASAGQIDDVVEVYREIMMSQSVHLPRKDRTIGATYERVSRTLASVGRAGEAVGLFRSLLASLEKMAAPNELSIADVRIELVKALLGAERVSEAVAAYSEFIAAIPPEFSREDTAVLKVVQALSHSLVKEDRAKEAIQITSDLLEDQSIRLGRNNPAARATRRSLAALHVRAGETDQAIDIYRSLLSERSTAEESDDETLRLHISLAAALTGEDRWDEAADAYRGLVTHHLRKGDTIGARRHQVSLIKALTRARRWNEALVVHHEIVEIEFARLTPSERDVVNERVARQDIGFSGISLAALSALASVHALKATEASASWWAEDPNSYVDPQD